MTDEERKALVQTVRLEAELNANYNQTVFRMLHRIGHALEADGKRIAELEAALAARDAEIAALRERVAELEARLEVVPGVTLEISDGIACRDETIRLQDQRINRFLTEADALRKEVEALRGALGNLIAACDAGRTVPKGGACGMTIEAQIRASVINGVPAWPVEEARAALERQP